MHRTICVGWSLWKQSISYRNNVVASTSSFPLSTTIARSIDRSISRTPISRTLVGVDRRNSFIFAFILVFRTRTRWRPARLLRARGTRSVFDFNLIFFFPHCFLYFPRRSTPVRFNSRLDVRPFACLPPGTSYIRRWPDFGGDFGGSERVTPKVRVHRATPSSRRVSYTGRTNVSDRSAVIENLAYPNASRRHWVQDKRVFVRRLSKSARLPQTDGTCPAGEEMCREKNTSRHAISLMSSLWTCIRAIRNEKK